MSQEENATLRLLSYRELMLTLQKLCKDQQSGVMVINSDSGNIAKLTLDQGAIFDVSFGNTSGTSALLLIKKISQGKASFFKRAQGNAARHIDLSTEEIFQILIGTLLQPSTTPAVQKNTPVQTALEEQMLTIEAYLAAIVGPVSRVLYADYKDEVQQLFDLNALNLLIEKIAQQVLMGEQQIVFKHNIDEFIQCNHLGNEQAILTAVKSAGRTLKLNPATLSLCISKHAAQGESSSALLAKLLLQLESAGNLVGIIALADILKFLEKTTKTGLLTVNTQDKKAGFYFDQGALINAIEGEREGIQVAMEVLQWKPTKIIFTSLTQVAVTRKINQSVTVLISCSSSSILSKEEGLKFTKAQPSSDELQDSLAKEIARLQNKALERKTEVTEADSLAIITDAVHLAKSYDLIDAESLLSHALMNQDDSYTGWMWLERTLNSMTVIEFALKKAAHINPKSSELADDVKKFIAARKEIKSDFVLRCPFCWMPVKEKDSKCPHCLGNFFIDPTFFKKVGKAKIDIIDKAINRYNQALQEGVANSTKVYLHFYLAMAYLNREYYQEGLEQLQEIATLAPKNRALLQQGFLLKQHMKSTGLISASDQQANSQDLPLTNAKILVVEDSMVTRKVIARTLVASGYEVIEAKDADEALNDIEAKNPNLILLDIILPGRSGYEILAEIKTMPKLAKVPVIMLTSRDSLFDKIKGKVSDADEYLTKPFQPDELLMIVKKYLK